MKFRYEEHEPSDRDELHAVNSLKQRLHELNDKPSPVPPTYWAGLIVNTNRRIDEASSAKAISISWAARVAIPGIVSILFFFIGLHYYTPDVPRTEYAVESLVRALPEDAVDSMLIQTEQLGTALASSGGDIFQFSNEQITDYLSERGSSQLLLENMNDAEVSTLLVALDARKNL